MSQPKPRPNRKLQSLLMGGVVRQLYLELAPPGPPGLKTCTIDGWHVYFRSDNDMVCSLQCTDSNHTTIESLNNVLAKLGLPPVDVGEMLDAEVFSISAAVKADGELLKYWPG